VETWVTFLGKNAGMERKMKCRRKRVAKMSEKRPMEHLVEMNSLLSLVESWIATN